MNDLDLIPPYLHPRVSGIESPAYAGKLSAVLHPGEKVDLAAVGGFASVRGSQSLASVETKPALLVATDQRLLAISPTRRGLLGTKSPAPSAVSFAPVASGNVFDAGYVVANGRRATASVCGSAPDGMVGAFVIWVLDVGDADNGNLWAITLLESISQRGGATRRPNGL